MKNRILFDTDKRQFAITPAFGIVWTRYDAYRVRAAFMWGPFRASIGILRRRDDD